jgi:ABC-type nitrate/sulfonate/bicarbonate transport system ATPase subunit
MAPPRSPGADPQNLWGNAREGSDVPSGLRARAAPSSLEDVRGDAYLSSITHSYTDTRGRRLQVLQEVSLHLPARSVLAVVGPSGCGKTTLLELICGLQQPQEGSLSCPPAVLMPQRDLLLPWFSALDNAALAPRIGGLSRAQARERAASLFCELGLDGFQDVRPHELSGGMRQRVAFLRTLLSGKPLLCLDEPFGALDAITRLQMQRWLIQALQREPRTVVLVTHDVEEAILLADRVLVLSPRPGRVIDEFEVHAGWPRAHTDPDVLELRERALRALGIAAVRGPE